MRSTQLACFPAPLSKTTQRREEKKKMLCKARCLHKQTALVAPHALVIGMGQCWIPFAERALHI